MWFALCKMLSRKLLIFSTIHSISNLQYIFPFIQGVILGLIFLDETDETGQRVIRRDTMTFPAKPGDKQKTSQAANVSMFNLFWHFLIVAIIANIIIK